MRDSNNYGAKEMQGEIYSTTKMMDLKHFNIETVHNQKNFQA